jgi:DNA-binding response OmpR family regulator
LLARAQAVLRRAKASTKLEDAGQIASGDLLVNFETKTARVSEDIVPLSRLEWDVLFFMAHHPDRVMVHTELKERAWGSTLVDDSVVKMCIRRIRGKITDTGGDPTVIVTHRGSGYSFQA